jgi:hypothetical protein
LLPTKETKNPAYGSQPSTFDERVFSFFCFQQKKETKKIHRFMKFAKNQRHSLNFGISALWASDSPKFLTLIPRFSRHKFHEAGKGRLRAEN